VSPCRVFGISRSAFGASPPERILSWTFLVVQSHSSAAYRRTGFAIPLRRWPFPRPWGFPRADAGRERVNAATHTSHRLQWSSRVFSRLILAVPGCSRQHQGRLLSWASHPYSTFRRRGSTSRGPCQGPLRSASRVWLPS
jgi:hypothetical protein